MRYEIGWCVRSVFAMSSISTYTACLFVTTDVSRGDCGDVPPVNSDLLVKPLRDVFHLTRGSGDVANKQTVRQYIAEAFRNASTLASALVNKSFVEEQQFDWVGYLFISIQFIPIWFIHPNIHHAHTHTRAHTPYARTTHTHPRTHTRTHASKHTHVHTHARTHARTHAGKHPHTHVHTHNSLCVWRGLTITCRTCIVVWPLQQTTCQYIFWT